jgi:hypothetical protein
MKILVIVIGLIAILAACRSLTKEERQELRRDHIGR